MKLLGMAFNLEVKDVDSFLIEKIKKNLKYYNIIHLTTC
jgi:hypothetical protein